MNAALGNLLLLSNAPGVDFSKGGLHMNVTQGSGGHGKHGTTTAPPPDHQPLVLEWAEFFRRACDMAELDIAQERGEVPRPTHTRGQGRDSGIAAKRRQRIQRLDIYRGRAPEFVAYIEGCSVTLVREARQAGDLDPLTGQRAERPLTSSRPSKS